MKTKENVILITGASSGIGQAIAELLAKDGNIVYGTSRKLTETMENHTDDIKMLKLDVTDEASVVHTLDEIIKREKRIDVLINCAGFGISGPIEAVPIEMAKKQFDVNFFGTVQMIQKTLPYMRKQKKGLIITIGSVAGYISIPFQSMYSASKFALESLSETLRMELNPFNINVCLVEPGDTRTNFTQSRVKGGVEEILAFYEPACEHALAVMEKDEENGYSPYMTALTVKRILKRKNPPVRVTVGLVYKIFYVLTKIIPTKTRLLIIRKKYINI